MLNGPPNRGGGGTSIWNLFGAWTLPIYIALVLMFVTTGAITDALTSVISFAGKLLTLVALLAIIGGAVAVGIALLLKLIKHQAVFGHGNHMFQNGLMAVVGGTIILAGGLNVLFGLVTMAAVRVEARVQMPQPPSVLQAQSLPGLWQPSAPPAPTPTPTGGQGQR
jgi:hypothetical protein